MGRSCSRLQTIKPSCSSSQKQPSQQVSPPAWRPGSTSAGLGEAKQPNVSDAFLTVLSALSSLPAERLPAPCPAACAGGRAGRRPSGSHCAWARPCRTMVAAWVWLPNRSFPAVIELPWRAASIRARLWGGFPGAS